MSRSVGDAAAYAANHSPATTDDRPVRSDATSATDSGCTDDGFRTIGTNGQRANKGAGGNGEDQ